MRSLLASLLLLVAAPLLSETLGQVEYQLPSDAWGVFNTIENDQHKTILYTPKELPKEEITEFFGVSATQFPIDLNDRDSIKNALTAVFPGKEVNVYFLGQDDHSILYEWSMKNKEKELSHGWSRVFKTDKGSTVLGYQTEKADHIDRKRTTWLPVLKAAKLEEVPAVK